MKVLRVLKSLAADAKIYQMEDGRNICFYYSYPIAIERVEDDTRSWAVYGENMMAYFFEQASEADDLEVIDYPRN